MSTISSMLYSQYPHSLLECIPDKAYSFPRNYRDIKAYSVGDIKDTVISKAEKKGEEPIFRKAGKISDEFVFCSPTNQKNIDAKIYVVERKTWHDHPPKAIKRQIQSGIKLLNSIMSNNADTVGIKYNFVPVYVSRRRLSREEKNEFLSTLVRSDNAVPNEEGINYIPFGSSLSSIPN